MWSVLDVVEVVGKDLFLPTILGSLECTNPKISVRVSRLRVAICNTVAEHPGLL